MGHSNKSATGAFSLNNRSLLAVPRFKSRVIITMQFQHLSFSSSLVSGLTNADSYSFVLLRFKHGHSFSLKRESLGESGLNLKQDFSPVLLFYPRYYRKCLKVISHSDSDRPPKRDGHERSKHQWQYSEIIIIKEIAAIATKRLRKIMIRLMF